MSRYCATGSDVTVNSRRAGWQALHVAIDDHSRVGFSQVLADATAMCACAFLLEALRYYEQLGVRVEGIMTATARTPASPRSGSAAAAATCATT